MRIGAKSAVNRQWDDTLTMGQTPILRIDIERDLYLLHFVAGRAKLSITIRHIFPQQLDGCFTLLVSGSKQLETMARHGPPIRGLPLKAHVT